MTLWHLFVPIVVLFGAFTIERLEHLVWAAAFFIFFLLLASGYKSIASEKSMLIRYWFLATRPTGRSHAHAFLLAIFVLFLGSWIPDIDWSFGMHRSPLTHSILPYVLLSAATRHWRFGDREWGEMLLPVFGFALGSHLIIDFFQGGNLVGIEYEFAFYASNGVAVCTLSYFRMRRALLPIESPARTMNRS